ncbi:hypothetical protein NP233_g4827 [Leucocoprinus birnbaumii]|uniref:Uncharacterized protein n=1 Tax=Leucocoprinus birnbaumii TaxID=56174 RepID=A0AAD5VU29_9AGAR|nr:hypothetical protein NP233_g4827 [Leucocoprinus birnbaumii]
MRYEFTTITPDGRKMPHPDIYPDQCYHCHNWFRIVNHHISACSENLNRVPRKHGVRKPKKTPLEQQVLRDSLKSQKRCGSMPRNNKIQENPVDKPAGDDARSPSISRSLCSASGEPSPLVLPSPRNTNFTPTPVIAPGSPVNERSPSYVPTSQPAVEELSSPLEPFCQSPTTLTFMPHNLIVVNFLALEFDQGCDDDHMHYEDDLEVLSQCYPEDHQEGIGMMTDNANGTTATDNQRLPGEGPFEFALNLITEPSTHDAAGRETTPRLRTDLKNVNIHVGDGTRYRFEISGARFRAS